MYILTFIIIGILCSFILNNQYETPFIFNAILIVLILGFYSFSLFCIGPWRAYKKIKDIVYDFTFRIDDIEIKTNKPDVSATAQYRYEGILKAYERKDAFYFYVDKRRAFIVSKDGFTEAGTEELRSFLKNKMNNKFRR